MSNINSLDQNSKRRSRNVIRQISLSIILKGISIALSFALIPITLKYLGSEQYGIWIVLLSLMSWITLFDIGIGNGLRNKLTKALTENNYLEARQYISTAYCLLGGICISLLVLLYPIILSVNWVKVFNSTLLSQAQYISLLLTFFSAILLSFIFSLINPIFNAFQLTSLTNIGNILTSCLFLLLLLLFKDHVFNDLLVLIKYYCLSLLISNILVSVWFFVKKKNIYPKIRYYNKKFQKDILSLGGHFFVIQISIVFIFAIDNFLIIQLLGPSYVSIYSIVFKIFSIFTLGFTILISPLWSAYTEAYIEKDYLWIQKTISKLQLSLIPIVVLLVLTVLFCQDILDLWLPSSERMIAPMNLVISLAIFVFISIWNNIYSFFLNGINETKMQVRVSVIGAVINIPIAYFLIKHLHLGLEGVVISMCISLSIFSFCGYFATSKIIRNLTKNNDKT